MLIKLLSAGFNLQNNAQYANEDTLSEILYVEQVNYAN